MTEKPLQQRGGEPITLEDPYTAVGTTPPQRRCRAALTRGEDQSEKYIACRHIHIRRSRGRTEPAEVEASSCGPLLG